MTTTRSSSWPESASPTCVARRTSPDITSSRPANAHRGGSWGVWSRTSRRATLWAAGAPTGPPRRSCCPLCRVDSDGGRGVQCRRCVCSWALGSPSRQPPCWRTRSSVRRPRPTDSPGSALRSRAIRSASGERSERAAPGRPADQRQGSGRVRRIHPGRAVRRAASHDLERVLRPTANWKLDRRAAVPADGRRPRVPVAHARLGHPWRSLRPDSSRPSGSAWSSRSGRPPSSCRPGPSCPRSARSGPCSLCSARAAATTQTARADAVVGVTDAVTRAPSLGHGPAFGPRAVAPGGRSRLWLAGRDWSSPAGLSCPPGFESIPALARTCGTVTIQNGTVSPGSGTTATTFAFWSRSVETFGADHVRQAPRRRES